MATVYLTAEISLINHNTWSWNTKWKKAELLATQINSYKLHMMVVVISTHSHITQETEFHVLLWRDV